MAIWGNGKIVRSNKNLRELGIEEYDEIDSWEDEIDGVKVIRRRYGNNEITKEDVYIARAEDMIIIRYQNFTGEFENTYDDVDRVIRSFRPLE